MRTGSAPCRLLKVLVILRRVLGQMSVLSHNTFRMTRSNLRRAMWAAARVVNIR